MYAIFQYLGKQYKVVVGDFLKLPKTDVNKGEKISFEILFLKNNNGELLVGSPLVDGVHVHAEVVEQIKEKKIIVFKKKRRQNYRRKNGHRQDLTLVKIIDIANSEKKNSAKNKEPDKKKKTEIVGEKNGS